MRGLTANTDLLFTIALLFTTGLYSPTATFFGASSLPTVDKVVGSDGFIILAFCWLLSTVLDGTLLLKLIETVFFAFGDTFFFAWSISFLFFGTEIVLDAICTVFGVVVALCGILDADLLIDFIGVEIIALADLTGLL